MTGGGARWRALVLGGGGPAGAAWLGGMAAGLVKEQVDLRSADEILGTSAGAVLGAWLAADVPLDGFTAAMRDRAAWHAAHATAPDLALLNRMGMSAGSGHPTEAEVRLLAMQARQAMEPRPVGQVAELWQRWLPTSVWPPRLRMVAVDADTGQATVWHRVDGLTVPEGITTTTAAPGAAAPVILRDRTWVDGGVRSSTNADLVGKPEPADGPVRVLVLAPKPGPALGVELAGLRGLGAEVMVVTPDERGRAALEQGVLSADAADAAARAALAQASDTSWLRLWWRTGRRPGERVT